ncbi:MAG: SPOR domain-containing protein [Nitrospinae bacterium]|nr:SPOR domain-containing protein [Nitrospinota bacterium]
MFAFFLLAVFPPGLCAFTLGAITIKSGFGEKFDAEIDLVLHDPGSVRIAVGTDEDYQRLGLKRPPILNELKIAELPGQGDNRIIKVVSDRPLFYPSFNLVVRAEKDGGAILENYLVAVDFQHNVSLAFKDEKKDKKQNVEELVSSIPTPDGLKNETVPQEPKGIVPQEPTNKETVPQGPPKVERPSPQESALLPVPDSREPVPLAEKALSPDKPKSAEGISPKPLPPTGPQEKQESAIERRAEAPDSVKLYGPVVPGETLSTISEKLPLAPGETTRLSVAIWMANRDKFIGGNMHGMVAGETLDLGKALEYLSQVDRKTAFQIARQQWEEWKLAPGKGRPPAKPADLDRAVPPESPLPYETAPDLAGVLSALEDWRKSWEDGDLDRHMALFASGGGAGKPGDRYAVSREFKKKLFDRHKDVKIRVLRPSMVHANGTWLVSFDQVYRSDKMESLGRKTVELTREGGQWKIRNERFALKRFLPGKKDGERALALPEEPDKRFPYVIRVSSHSTLASARAAVNRLREMGFNAYSSAIKVADGKKVHGAFVERFGDWDLAERMTQGLRKIEIARNAVPERYPFALELGVYDSEKEALERIKTLRENGHSSYLFGMGESPDFTGMKFRVLLGAFNARGNADEAATELNRQGMTAAVIAP